MNKISLILPMMLVSQFSMAAALFGSGRVADSNSADSGNGNGNFQFYQTLQTYGSTGSCSGVPSHVQTALSEAKSFSESCPAARVQDGKYFAINDYSGQAGPTMYIFDKSGNCRKAVRISWGVGTDRSGRLEACSTANSKKTPPGFHITARHLGGSVFNDSNAIGMASLSGQDSLGRRGILIHAVESPGTASTWGCTGVPAVDFANIKSTLGVGSLVYNYFGNGGGGNCSDPDGFKPPKCQPEQLAISAARQAGNSNAGNQRSGTGSSGGGTYRGDSGGQ